MNKQSYFYVPLIELYYLLESELELYIEEDNQFMLLNEPENIKDIVIESFFEVNDQKYTLQGLGERDAKQFVQILETLYDQIIESYKEDGYIKI